MATPLRRRWLEFVRPHVHRPVEDPRIPIQVQRDRLGRVPVGVKVARIGRQGRVVSGVDARRAGGHSQIVVLSASDVVQPVGVNKQGIDADVAGPT